MKKSMIWIPLIIGCVLVVTAEIVGCGGGSSGASGSTSTQSRTLNVYTTTGTSHTDYFENPLTSQLGSSACNTSFNGAGTNCTSFSRSCTLNTIDTSSCQSARQTLGLSGNWLKFSCNVVLGCADSSRNAMSTCTGATYVSIWTASMPDYTSPYYNETGSYSFTANSYTVTGTYSSLYAAYTTAFPDPSYVTAESITMYVPIAPAVCSGGSCNSGSGATNAMGMGVVGVAINGVVIFDNLASGTDNIFAEDGSFDQCSGHPANGKYHYHSEPPSITHDDSNLVGVMRDGFFVYGRRDSDNSVPGSLANQVGSGNTNTNLIYYYGGHTGTAPSASDSNSFHYHATEWIGCYDETSNNASGFYYTDNGITYDTYNTLSGVTKFTSGASPGTPNTASNNTYCKGTWVDGWFLSGHGNGGMFQTPSSIGTSGGTGSEASPVWTSSTSVLNSSSSVSAASSQAFLSQITAGLRYYYGTPGYCSGC